MQDKLISVSATSLGGNEHQYIKQCLDNKWLSQGAFVREFESRFADYLGVKHALTCSSGTAALHLAMLALDVSENDAVIVPALTYVATANVARYCGAKVYFADVDKGSWCLDLYFPIEIEIDKDFNRVIAIPVQLYDSITLPIAVDDVISVTDSSQHVSSLGHDFFSLASTYSFYASKHVSCGEGGMVVTNDDELADRIRLFRGQGATRPGEYYHSVVGYNYRMTDLQAAVGLAQLETLDERIRYRREIIDRYRERLGENSKIILQGGERASAWMFACLLPDGPTAIKLWAKLYTDYGIETRPFFQPLNSLPMYGSDSSSTPTANEVYRRGICLPTHCEMDDNDVDYICDSLEEVLG